MCGDVCCEEVRSDVWRTCCEEVIGDVCCEE